MNRERIQYLGILASNKDINGSLIQDTIFVNGQNELQFTVKLLSKEELPSSLFSGYINVFDEACDIAEEYYKGYDERIDNFRKELEGKLILFSYHGTKQSRYHNMGEAQVVAQPPQFNRTIPFVSMNVFSANGNSKIDGSCQQFVSRVRKNPSEFSSMMLWKEENGAFYVVTSDLSGVKVRELGEYESQLVYDEWVNPNLAFLPESVCQFLQESPVAPVNEAVKPGIQTQAEEQLLNQVKYYCQEMDLLYEESDLLNFHTAVKCSDLVILSGMSGTGKSALVDVYAKALGVTTENKQLLCIPVAPSWNDDADLLGELDVVNKIYHASDTGFLNLLMEAQKKENEDKLYIVCLDEMNLARVEHYFSQFLSILEKPMEERSLTLYDAQYSDKLENGEQYPCKIKIGSNIKFIGTVNIDESTYHFSDKVLDRANVITLDVVDYSKEVEYVVYASQQVGVWSAKQYQAMVCNYARNQELRGLLWEIHMLFQQSNLKMGIGPRIVKCMEEYLSNLPKGESIEFSMEEAMDYQMVQRVLTKVRGPENQLGLIFGNGIGAGILPIFDKYQHLSMFNKSRRVIEHKKNELETYGYCI